MITVQTSIKAPLEDVWECWTHPDHIVHWNHASDEWYTPHAANDLRLGGTFLYRRESTNGSEGFDFGGTYTSVREFEYIEYTLDDCRKVKIGFNETEDGTELKEAFEPEQTNTSDQQQQGWQAILDNFKNYVESKY